VSNFVSFAVCIAELAHGEKSYGMQSINQFDARGTEALALWKASASEYSTDPSTM